MGARVACVGCDEGGGITYSRSRFNPRALIEQVYRWVVFQSTRPRGARPLSVITSPPSRCFNPRARAGRDAEEPDDDGADNVSIHAPARGATS